MSTQQLEFSQALNNHLRRNKENDREPKWHIKKSKLGGRGIFASEEIKRGTLIFINKPLVVAPRHLVDTMYCTTCYNMCDSCYTCDKCSMITCSEECKQSVEHTTVCDFIVQNWNPRTNCEKSARILAQVSIYIRILMLNPEELLLLSTLQSGTTIERNDELEMLCLNYVIPEEQIQFIKSVAPALKINVFRLPSDTQKKISLRGLFPLSSFLNHSCVPNTRNVFRKDHSMAVYASRDIGSGEEILTCYTALLWSTPARRFQLYKTKHFWCRCRRCQDTTEMGTRLAALKCLNKDCIGVILPVTSLEPETDWLCDNCGAVESPARVSMVQSALGSLVGTLDLDDQFRLEACVLERLANFIPNSSHIFIDLRFRLALRLGFSERFDLNGLSEARLALKESLSRGTLRTLAALGLGDVHLRGLLLYHLHAALAERARRRPDLYEELKSEIESTIEQAYNILQDDISAPPDLDLRRRYLGPGCDKPQEEKFFILDS